MKKLFMNSWQRSVVFLTLLLLTTATFAVPAKPGIKRLLTLADGTTVNAVLVGDEYAHYWLGEDGLAYQSIDDVSYQRVDLQAIKQRAAARRSAANQRRMRRLTSRKVGEVGSITGQKKGIIILVNFKNKSFTATQNDFNKLANQVNYVSGKYKGSMRDYFYAQSEGQFELTFDVVGPYTVSQNYSYYGENDYQGDDKHPAEMVIEALKLADPYVNFADYDWDGDGTVEQVYVVYAGKGEADGGATNTIWPHEYELSSAEVYGDGDGIQCLDGVYINTYACGSEQNGSTGATAGIGTMCHEFSHCLGYPDFYDTDYSGGQGMFAWDLMDSGSYNDDGYRPAGYTSYERWVAGWKEPIELVYTQNITNMGALQTNGSNTYVIYNKGNRNEYYLLENRQKTGWVTSLPGAGLLILHVDYNATVWANNKPNDDPSHQRMTWVAADNEYQYTMYQGTKYFTESGAMNDPFPYGSVNAFGKNTTPAAKLYNKNIDNTYYLDSSIDNITQNSDGTISFTFNGESGSAIAADESLTFSTSVGTSQTLQLNVMTERLQDDVVLTLSDANNVFSLSTNTIPSSEEEATIDVTFTPSMVGTFTGTITLTSMGADPVTVKLSATADDPSVVTLLYEGLRSYSSSGDGMAALATTNKFLDYDGWATLTKVYAGGTENALSNGGCLKLGTGSATGSMKTGNISLTGEGTLMFYLRKYGNDTGKLNVSVTGATADVTQFTPTDAWTLCIVHLTEATGEVTLTFATSSKRAYLDEIMLTRSKSSDIDPSLAYYQNADGQMGAALKTAMSGIVYNRTEKTYNYLWTAFQTTDLRSDGKIWDMYSNITNYEPSSKGETYSAEGDCYNREHSFPKSWFGGEVTPMFTDLHHIYPVDGYINGRRSNNPYGETNGNTYKSANDFSKLGACTYPGYTGTVFEPADEYKGDFARTYFYMVTCYEEKLHDWYTNFGPTTEVDDVLDGTTYPAFTTWQLNMLMNWAKNDPVSEKEIARNNAVYAIQNNRNPFIDYPGLEEYVWGSMTTTAFSYDNYVRPVYKQDVVMSFSPAEATATLGKDFTEPTLTTTPDNLTVAYSSSEPAVATVDATTGEVTLVAAGTTTITATFAGDETYNGATASYILTVKLPSGPVEGSGTYALVTDASTLAAGDKILIAYVSGTTNKTMSVTQGNNNRAAVDVTKNADGTLTPGKNAQVITLEQDGGNYLFNVGNGYLYAASSSSNHLKTQPQADANAQASISISNGDATIVFQGNNTRNHLRYNPNGGSPLFSCYAETSNMAKPQIYREMPALTLTDGETTNASIIEANAGKKAVVTLAGRTLYRDGSWNTLCLPFNVTLAGSPLAGATAKTLTNAELTGTYVTLTFGPDVDELEAGVPYIIMWEDTQGDNIVEPLFTDVTIVHRTQDERTITKANGHVQFIGYYDAFEIHPDINDDIYYLTSDNQLKHTAKTRTLKACRAYFQFSDEAQAHQMMLDFGTDIDDPTAIVGTDAISLSTEWYTLSGLRLNGKPTAKGIYLNGGKKVVVK